MHNPDYTPNSTLEGLSSNSFGSSQIQLRFSPNQQNILTSPALVEQAKLGDLIKEKVQNKEFFYGIEIAAHNFGPRPAVLDYNIFGALLPLFTSVIWFGADYCKISQLKDVEAIRMAGKLQERTNVLPHFTAYRLDKPRLEQFLQMNFTNVLALRGDQFDSMQEFKYATEMVALMKSTRGDTISIGVGGYPEGHTESKSLDDDIKFLAEKVKTGADFIITQVCFSAEAIKTFVRKCRENDITVPIVVGIFIPDSWQSLQRMMQITGANLSDEQLESFRMLRKSSMKFMEHAIEVVSNMIVEVFESDLGIYGIHFFTVNRFGKVPKLLAKLNEKYFDKISLEK